MDDWETFKVFWIIVLHFWPIWLPALGLMAIFWAVVGYVYYRRNQ